jgi:hypothetical protein
MGGSRKFHNVQVDPQVSLVVDDLSTKQGWQVRGVEIRGRSEAITDVEPPMPGFSREIIRIYPERILSWGLDGSSRRNVAQLAPCRCAEPRQLTAEERVPIAGLNRSSATWQSSRAPGLSGGEERWWSAGRSAVVTNIRHHERYRATC